MFQLLSKLIAILSLPAQHHLGARVGQCIYFFNPSAAKNAKNNLKTSQLAQTDEHFRQILNANIQETGKAIIETLAIWAKPQQEILALVKNVHGWDLVEAALAQKKGIIFLTPHMGCFEVTSIYYGSRQPITVLFRAPKLKFLLPLILKGRQRKGVTLAEANASGVRKLMQALKKGEAVGILPDQIPKAGEGEWADFFGKPAYTMTLASKLAEKTGAAVIMAFGERLANGEGYDIHLTKVDSIATPTLLNQAIAQQIAQKPEQYLWQYHRYKVRRHSKKNATHLAE